MKQKTLINWHIASTLIIIGLGMAHYRLPSNNCKDRKYERILQYNYEVNGIDSRLLEAIIQVESSGRAKVVSHKGAIGLMQIMPKYWLDYCKLSSSEQLKQPHHNINCGTEVLKHYLKHTNNDLREALAMYNGGYRKPKESYIYADKVLDLFTRL